MPTKISGQLLQRFNNNGARSTASIANSGHTKLSFLFPQDAQQSRNNPSPTCSQCVPKCNSTAVLIHSVLTNVEELHVRQSHYTACFNAFGIARDGAVVNFDGCFSASPHPRIFAIGFRLCDFRTDSETRTSAAAPSESGEALAAVTVPPCGLNAGFSVFILSSLKFLGSSSCSTVMLGFPLPCATSTGTISCLNHPFS